MKYLLLVALVALASGRPQEEKTLADYGILRFESTQNEDGSFQYGYETSDPAAQDVSGENRQIGEEEGNVQRGSYSFTAEDENGLPVEVLVNWTADENGFQAQSDALPVAPEDPNAAAQAAAYEKFSNL